MVLLALLSIFIYLLFVVAPLFTSASLVPAEKGIAEDASVNALISGSNDALSIAYHIDKQGTGRFATPTGGFAPAPLLLLPALTAAVPASNGEPLYLLLNAAGKFRLTSPVLDSTPGWAFPFGDQVNTLEPTGSLSHPALARTGPEQALFAGQLASGRLAVVQMTPTGKRVTLSGPLGPVDQLLLSSAGDLLYALAGNQLSIYSIDTDGVLQLRERKGLSADGPVAVTLLASGGGLLITEAERHLSLWFDVPTPAGYRLTHIRDFAASLAAQTRIITAARSPLFAVLNPSGDLQVFSSRQSAALLSKKLPAGSTAWLSADGSSLTSVAQHSWQRWQLLAPSPDISWRTLTQKVWYRHYPAPTWTWQSASLDSHESGKYSLVPLVTGSLKAALYAMLFATPLALAAAMYTAWFMSPGLRRFIKPAMEVMGAVPSVIIGVLAGLWLAPRVSEVLSAVLMLPLVLPLVILGAGRAIASLPAGWGIRLRGGAECLILLPVIALTLWGMVTLSPWLDGWLFSQPLSAWLGDGYNPMNALVVGIAMGFALIPLMFTLAEEALFNVPVHMIQGSLALGATPWQTLIGVTLPSASTGLCSAFILGLGRAVGETMIVLLASGNMPLVDGSLFEGLRSLAANIAIEIPEAALNSEHYRVLFLTALVLFVFTFIINTVAETLRLQLRSRYRHQQGEA
ncbi:ABC transporter permease subunit [Biostraticola tofi]|uniref:Phosphate transport system permease protein n=1 Tax=Biostraticola tofi TaxID=466109 RepID=A0A4R3YM92_9GAMM|nr:ABC transporter permease subunit [Biostraticola tofi]TCV91943.1 phosphate transport system permease protein [Biostraticola tofi]